MVCLRCLQQLELEPLPRVTSLCQPRILDWVQRRPPSSRLWVSPPRSQGEPLKSWWVLIFNGWRRCRSSLKRKNQWSKHHSHVPLLFRVMLVWSRLVTRLVPARRLCSTCWTSRPSPSDSSSSRCMTMAVSTALRSSTSPRLPFRPGSWRWAVLRLDHWFKISFKSCDLLILLNLFL